MQLQRGKGKTSHASISQAIVVVSLLRKLRNYKNDGWFLKLGLFELKVIKKYHCLRCYLLRREYEYSCEEYSWQISSNLCHHPAAQ